MESDKKITVKDYMKIKALYELHGDNKEAIIKDLLKYSNEIKLADANKKILGYLEGLNNKQDSLTQKFKINGIEFGLIPDFEELTVAEYIDIDKYESDYNNIHRLLSVLYRPITSSYGNKYNIEEYEGTSKYSDTMLDVDINIYHGVIAFFLTLNEILLKDTQESFQKNKKQKQKNLQKD